MLEEAVAPQEGEVEEKVPCPAGIVGRIIGRGGETIRSLQQGSNAHILVDQNFPEGADRCVQQSAGSALILHRGMDRGRHAGMKCTGGVAQHGQCLSGVVP